MSLLSDRIRHFLMLHRDTSGRYDLRATVAEVKPTLTDEESSDLLDDVLYQRAKQAATKGKKNLDKHAAKTSTADMFAGIETGYAIDDHTVKDTDELTEVEFQRVIDIRKVSLDADVEKLAQLEIAQGACAPIWKAHPNWTFGQCKAELARRKRTPPGSGKGKGGGPGGEPPPPPSS